MTICIRNDCSVITVGFMGFHASIPPVFNHLVRGLIHKFNLDVVEKTPDGHLARIPDILFTSCFNNAGNILRARFKLFDSWCDPNEVPLYLDQRYNGCIKIHNSDECLRPPWDECDYALTGDYDSNPHHLRLPVYVRDWRYLHDFNVVKQMRNPNTTLTKQGCSDWEGIFRTKTKFCNFICSNPNAKERIRFLELLSKYKAVDSGGSVMNNLGSRVGDKLPFIEDYKFTIAFENTSYPGYVTEKPFEAMVARSLPIYWGSSTIKDDFNPDSMIVATGRTLEDVVDEVVALDRDDSAYVEKMQIPWFHGDLLNSYCRPEYLTDFFDMILKERKAS